MDAHFPGADVGLSSYGDDEDIDKRLPLKKELETIVAKRDISNDVIVIESLTYPDALVTLIVQSE